MQMNCPHWASLVAQAFQVKEGIFLDKTKKQDKSLGR